MEQKENFEDIIRGKFAGQQITPDAKHAQQMQSMIKARGEKRKRRGFIILFLALFLLSGLFLIPFVSSTEPKTLLSENQKKQNEETKNSPIQTTKTETLKEEEKNKTSVSQKNYPAEKHAETQTSENPVVENKKVTPSSTEEKRTAEKKKETSMPVPVVSGHTKKEPSVKFAPVTPTKQEDISQDVSQTGKEKETKKSEITTVETQPITPKEKNETIPVVTSTVTETIRTQVTPKETANTAVANTTTANSQLAKDTSAKIVSTPPVALTDSTSKKPDSTIVKTTQPEIPVKEPRANMLFAEAGTAYALGWNNNGTEGQGFTPIAGFGFSHNFNSSWSAQTGFQGTSVGYLNSSTHTITHTNNGFGYYATDSIIATKQLYYLTIPLQLNYHLNPKNSIGLGTTVSWLLSGSGKITTYDQSDDYGMTGKKEVSQTGYVKGFNPWNVAIILVYRRKLSNRFLASVIPYYGLTDIKNNSFFSTQKTERDMGVKVLISYNLFK